MSIFSKQKPESPSAAMRRTTPASRRPSHPPHLSSDQAMRQVHEAADAARAEIDALVREEHQAIEQAIATACEEVEQRLRGAAEQRIDHELRRVEEAEGRMRANLRRIVRSEMTAAQADRARAKAKAKSA